MFSLIGLHLALSKQGKCMHCLSRAPLVVLSVGLLSACSGGGGSADTQGIDSSAAVSEMTEAPAGNIDHYGAVTVSDDIGMAYDLVGSFYALETGVSLEFLNTMLNGETAHCQVQDDGVIDFEEISVGYIPQIVGVDKQAVSAGDSIVLSSAAGTYATLQERPAGGFLFYDLQDGVQLTEREIPSELTVAVSGSAEIPAFSGVSVPNVTALTGAAIDTGASVSINTIFSWESSTTANALVRIQTSTAGGFFLEDGVSVTCVVPDTGSFMFPTGIQAILGSSFLGNGPVMSRIVVNPVQADTTVLFIVRESFAAEF